MGCGFLVSFLSWERPWVPSAAGMVAGTKVGKHLEWILQRSVHKKSRS